MSIAAAAVLHAFAVDGRLSPLAAARVLAIAAAAFLATISAVVMHANPAFSTQLLPAWVDLCPRALVPAREALLSRLQFIAAVVGPVRSPRAALAS